MLWWPVIYYYYTRSIKYKVIIILNILLGVIHKRRKQEGGGGQAEADTCGHTGEGVKQKWPSTFGSKFKYLMARSEVRIVTPESINIHCN